MSKKIYQNEKIIKKYNIILFFSYWIVFLCHVKSKSKEVRDIYLSNLQEINLKLWQNLSPLSFWTHVNNKIDVSIVNSIDHNAQKCTQVQNIIKDFVCSRVLTHFVYNDSTMRGQGQKRGCSWRNCEGYQGWGRGNRYNENGNNQAPNQKQNQNTKHGQHDLLTLNVPKFINIVPNEFCGRGSSNLTHKIHFQITNIIGVLPPRFFPHVTFISEYFTNNDLVHNDSVLITTNIFN